MFRIATILSLLEKTAAKLNIVSKFWRRSSLIKRKLKILISPLLIFCDGKQKLFMTLTQINQSNYHYTTD